MHHIRGLEFCIWDYDTLLKIKNEKKRESLVKETKECFFPFCLFFFFQFSMHMGEARMGEMVKFNSQKQRKLKVQRKELDSDFPNYLSIITSHL